MPPPARGSSEASSMAPQVVEMVSEEAFLGCVVWGKDL